MVDTHDSITKFCVAATGTTKKYLREHPEICVLSADKGNRTVVMMRDDYDQKMRTLVNDDTTYERVRSDPTTRYQNGNNSLVKRLKDLKLIDYRTAKELTTNNAVCPRIYGQPKAHKQNLPLRPVIPNVTAPTYNLAKYIANILQSSIHSPYNTASSFEFCDEVNRITLPEGYIMISLDVTSLFTNVPRHLVTRNIIQRWKEVNTHINLDLFLEIVEYCMEASYFCFEGQYYKQVFGTAMGSPLSPIAADIALDSVIAQAMRSLPFEITIFRKYVDDIFMAIPRNTEQQVLQAFNDVEPRIQFTIETEKEQKLAFLDLTVIRNADQSLTTEWYAKPIASGRLLNYKSFHQCKHKINVAKNFIHRVWYLTRNKSTVEIAQIIHQHLTLNNYPRQLINRLLNLYGNKRQLSSLTQRLPTLVAATTPPSRPSCQQSPTPPSLIEITDDAPDNTQSRPSRQPPTPPAILPAVPTPPFCTQPSTSNQIQQQPSTSNQIQQQQPESPCLQPTASSIDVNEHQTSADPNRSINDPSRSTETITEQPETTKIDKIYRAIPYIPALSQRITKILARDYSNIAIATKQTRVIKNLHTQVKHPVNKDDISNVIYKIPCNNCDSCYIGMTTNTLRKRLAGHRSNINRLEKLTNDNNTNTEIAKTSLIETTTALIQHCIETDHRFNLEHTQIIDHSYRQSTLPFLEMCHITNTNHTINRRTDIDRLSTTYAAVLHDIKSRNERNETTTGDSIDERESITPIGHSNQSIS
ncbi:uncharacterized protein LOC134288585 [Aedes albopictus]